MSFRRAASRDDLWVGEMKGVIVDGVPVLLVALEDGVRAYEDRCLHKGIPLSTGRLAGTRLVCSAHAWEYDVSSGQGVNPSRVCLRSFPVRVVGEEIEVEVDVGDRPAVAPSTDDDVGPVIQAGPLGRAVIEAIQAQNPGARVVDRGAYLRVLCRGRCVVTRASIEEHAGVSFRLPGDLELVMSSFKGRFAVSEDEARWELSPRKAAAGDARLG
jgi:toluene monooxygenase system ferredoxin subunit